MDYFTISHGETKVQYPRQRFIGLFPHSLIATALQDLEADTLQMEHSDVTGRILLLLEEMVRTGWIIINPKIPAEEYTKAGRYLLIDELRLLADSTAQSFIVSSPGINLLDYDSLKDPDTYTRILDYAIEKNGVPLARFLFEHVTSSELDSKFVVVASLYECPEILKLILKRVEDPSRSRLTEDELCRYRSLSTTAGHIVIATNQALALAVQYGLYENVRVLLGNDKMGLVCEIDDPDEPDYKSDAILGMADTNDEVMFDLIVNDRRFDISVVDVSWVTHNPKFLKKLLPLLPGKFTMYSYLQTCIYFNNMESLRVMLEDSRVPISEEAVIYSLGILDRLNIVEILIMHERFTELTPRVMDDIMSLPHIAHHLLKVLKVSRFYPKEIRELRGRLLTVGNNEIYERRLGELGMI